MIYAILAIIASAWLRRFDGVDKDHWPFWKRFVIFNRYNVEIGWKSLAGFSTRSLPIVIVTLLFCYSFGFNPLNISLGILSGSLISGSLQMKYTGWENLTVYQAFHFWLGMAAYGLLAHHSLELAIVGVGSCLAAGMIRPWLDSYRIKNYTVYSEFSEGALLVMPFIVLYV